MRTWPRSRCQLVVFSLAIPGPQVAVHVLHQFVDALATVVSSDIGMQVLPSTFDLVVVRAIRRQELQPQPLTSFAVEAQDYLLCVVG